MRSSCGVPWERMRRGIAQGFLVLMADHMVQHRDQAAVALGTERREGERPALLAVVAVVLSLLIEGGAKVNWVALENRLLDKVFLYYAPRILGGTHGSCIFKTLDSFQLLDLKRTIPFTTVKTRRRSGASSWGCSA